MLDGSATSDSWSSEAATYLLDLLSSDRRTRLNTELHVVDRRLDLEAGRLAREVEALDLLRAVVRRLKDTAPFSEAVPGLLDAPVSVLQTLAVPSALSLDTESPMVSDAVDSPQEFRLPVDGTRQKIGQPLFKQKHLPGAQAEQI